MPTKIDLTGKLFGVIRVLSQAEHANDRIRYLCECACGKQFITYSCHLSSGKTTSCGCMKGAKISASKTIGPFRASLRGVHRHMMERCYNVESEPYINYGGRGIIVCPQWHDFNVFYNDLIPTYEKGLTLERKWVHGNYEPSNCKWATRIEQARNARSNIVVEYEGIKMCLSALTEKLNLNYGLIRRRLHRGWSLKDAIELPKLEKYSHPPLKLKIN